MIKVGTDIVSLLRIKSFHDKFKDKALKRFLCEDEIKLAKSIQTISGFWAAKEAFSKALGYGIGEECGFLDIQIIKNKKNAPFIKLTQNFKTKHSIKHTSLSISHDKNFAIAVVVIEFY